MIKAIELAKLISKEPELSYAAGLEDINLHKTFEPIYTLKVPSRLANIIVAYIIFAFDNDSNWLNLKQDRIENKWRILKSLGIEDKSTTFNEIVHNDNEIVNDVVASYLESQANWKFIAILNLLDWSANNMRFATQKTAEERLVEIKKKKSDEGDNSPSNEMQDYDIDVITRVNKQKGELLTQSIEKRKQADELISELKKEFVQLDNALQQDFGFEMTDEKKIDPMSWRHFIKYKVLPKKKAKE